MSQHGHNFMQPIHVKFGFGIEFLGIGGFTCDTLVHMGQRGVTMATNFGTKIATNAYKCICTRNSENVIIYNRVFSWSTNPWNMSDPKGLRDVAVTTKSWPK